MSPLAWGLLAIGCFVTAAVLLIELGIRIGRAESGIVARATGEME